ncbi:hypothetical protein [Catenuloplanes atrovinosus]|uniref:Uncharacterized protein n=1 Tax=Catenuloplanes atrovinosus TaxID=137266 RepID=A0AAE3YT42_9ACTN|nr:hypothetical protein [Catenuloplanes atrovinosus]MDR7277923.1 hypothetical protein [Catenuloplanes atrovinosus]
MRWRAVLIGVASLVAIASASVVVAAVVTRRPPVPLGADLVQYRTDQALRTVKIQLSNRGDAPVQVVRAELWSRSFAGTGPIDTDTLVRTGDVRTDIRVGYGHGVCTGPAATLTAEPATAVLGVRDGDGTREVALPLPYPSELLTSLLRADCEQAEVARVATATLAGLRARPDGALDAVVRLTRTGGTAPVTMTEVRGSVLYTLTPASSARTLAATQGAVDLPVTIDSNRCDPHAVGEVKKPYEFPAWLAVGDAPPVYTLIDVPAGARATLFGFVRERCALPG